jgi:hypothetical protein
MPCPLMFNVKPAQPIVSSQRTRAIPVSGSSRFTDPIGLFPCASAANTVQSGVSRSADEVVWFWVGPHEEYEKLLARR